MLTTPGTTIGKILKWTLTIYVGIAASVGTAVIAWPFITLLYNAVLAPAPLPVYLPSGFVYEIDRDANRGLPTCIKDMSGQVVVMPDVRDVMLYGEMIYGFRRGLAEEPYYYICTHGKDCSQTQHLTEMDFIQQLKEKGLPKYDARLAKTYDQLLREQSKTGVGKHGG